ncbi:MAG: helix-turn-helix transcriptional regulator [Clostridia bacterium]|nr:helix-turn-helix transcriptional regulator [Clostridia bacterium]
MENKTMGEMIAELRREKGMTQRDLAEKLNVSDKAVSKWERNVACPDIQNIPKLAEILGVSVDELVNAQPKEQSGHKGAGYLVNTILRAVPLAMGVAVVVASILNGIDTKSALIMLGIGMACLSIYLLKNKE